MHNLKVPSYLFLCVCLCSLFSCSQKESSERLEVEGKFSKQDRVDLAMAQEFRMTQDPVAGYIPRERLFAAENYMRTLSGGMASREAALGWEERGPSNVAGRTRALFIDSRDATGNTVFAASVSGGIWKATNFKTTPVWTPIFDAMANLAVCALVQDPSNPNIMYAGTGEGWFNLDAVRGNGIWKSINGGSSWAQLSSTDSVGQRTNFNYVQDLVVTNKGILFAATRSGQFCNAGGILRSINGGISWTRSLGNLTAQVCDSAFNYRGADLEIATNGDLYATTGFQGGLDSNFRGRIYRSSSALYGDSVGKSTNWQEITPTGNWQRIEIAIAPSDPATIYALLEGAEDGIGGIRKSSDFGATWQTIAPPTWCSQGTNSSDFTNEQAWFDLIVQVDPTDKNKVVIGGIDLFRSTNGGSTWVQMTQWANGCDLPTIHADQHNFLFYPGSTSEFIAANDGGIYYSNNTGATWANKNGGYNVTQLYSGDFHPINPNYFLTGAQDNGTQKFTQPGMNATTAVSGGDGAFAHIDQTDGNIQVSAFVYNNYFYSRNGGGSFTRLEFNDDGMFINPTDYDDAKDVLYTGNGLDKMGLVTNFNGTGTPAFSSVTLTQLGGREISAVKVDPTVTGGGTIWVAGYFEGTETEDPLPPRLLKLTNANTQTPTVAITSNLSVPAGAFISSIDVDPVNGARILVTLSNFGVTSVFLSTNNGTTFSNIEGNLPDMPVRSGLFVGPTSQLNGPTGGNGGILLATELGVWSTSLVNGGATLWLPNNTGMPANVRTDQLKYRTTDGLVLAATHGRGLFTTTLTGGVVTSVPNTAITKDFIKYISATSNHLMVVTGTLNTRKMDIRIFSMAGSEVYKSDQRYQNINIPLDAFSKGSYIIQIVGDKKENYIGQFIKK